MAPTIRAPPNRATIKTARMSQLSGDLGCRVLSATSTTLPVPGASSQVALSFEWSAAFCSRMVPGTARVQDIALKLENEESGDEVSRAMS
jgi:hypothetical protein